MYFAVENREFSGTLSPVLCNGRAELSLQVFCRGGGAGVDLQFFVGAVQMNADGVFADVKTMRDVRVAAGCSCGTPH